MTELEPDLKPVFDKHGERLNVGDTVLIGIKGHPAINGASAIVSKTNPTFEVYKEDDPKKKPFGIYTGFVTKQDPRPF